MSQLSGFKVGRLIGAEPVRLTACRRLSIDRVCPRMYVPLTLSDFRYFDLRSASRMWRSTPQLIANVQFLGGYLRCHCALKLGNTA
jgi:hypothetical protein